MCDISVIMPLYNKISYVKKTITALKAQTFSDFELIIVDDGSTDGSGEVADSFALTDNRIKVIHIPNGGVSNARNEALEIACGRYVTFVDADDTVSCELLAVMYGLAEKGEYDTVVCGMRKVYADGSYTEFLPDIEGEVPLSDFWSGFEARQRDIGGLLGACCCKLFKRELLEGVRFDTGLKLAEDLDFNIRVFDKATSFCFVRKSLYSYLQNAENSTAATADYAVDYKAQLWLRLRIADILKKHGAYSLVNRDIVSAEIGSFAVYTLFYASLDKRSEFKALFRSISDSSVKQEACFLCKGVFAPVALLYKSGLSSLCYVYLKIYRAARHLIGR